MKKREKEKRENWRLSKNNIAFRVLKGWLSAGIKNWLTNTAKTLGITPDDSLIVVAETIRKISHRVIQLLSKETGEKTKLPLFIIVTDPLYNLSLLNMALEDDKKKKYFTSREKTLERFGFLVAIKLQLRELEQITGLFNAKLIIQGSARDCGMSFFDIVVVGVLNDYLFGELKKEQRHDFLHTVIEETFHYFAYQTNQFQHAEMTQEQERVLSKIKDEQEQFAAQQEIERKYGVKKKVNELLAIIEKQTDLFSPLEELKKRTKKNTPK